MFATVFPPQTIMFELLKIAASMIGGLLSGIVLAYFKFWLDNRKKPAVTVDADLDRRNRVKSFQLHFMHFYKPASTSCYLLHNGGTFFTGEHMQKIKLYEETPRDSHVALLKPDFDSVPIEGPLHWWIDAMRENGKLLPGKQEEFICRDRDAITNPEFKAMMHHYGICCMFARLLRDPKSGAPVAVFVSSYDSPQEFIEADMYGLRTEAKNLAKILLDVA